MIPAHIAIIMDGNGRWAKKRGLPRIFGHRAAMKTVREIVTACADLGVRALTLYAFSTENWVRPEKEISGLMSLLRAYLKSELKTMTKNNIRLSVIGDISKLPAAASKELLATIERTKNNTGMVLNLALNYGGRDDIVRAARKAVEKGMKGLDEASFGELLDTAGLPDPDLMIRTSGEMRLSNFLLWQLAYSEIYVTPVLWPDFKAKHLNEAILDYQKRERRFGGVGEKK
jgi:undecaprenyl diphosphate synthase